MSTNHTVLSIVAVLLFVLIVGAIWLGRPDTPNPTEPVTQKQTTASQASDTRPAPAPTEARKPAAPAEPTASDSVAAEPEPAPQPRPSAPAAVSSETVPTATVVPNPHWVCTIWSDDNAGATAGKGRTCLQWTHR